MEFPASRLLSIGVLEIEMTNVTYIKKQTREQRQAETLEKQRQEIELQNAMVAQLLYDEEKSQ